MSSTGRARERARFNSTVELERNTHITESIKADIWKRAQIEVEIEKARIWEQVEIRMLMRRKKEG